MAKVKVKTSKNKLFTYTFALITGILKLLISLLISIFIIFPIFTLIFGTNEICRLFVKIYYKFKYGNKVKIANGRDGAYGGCESSFIIRNLTVYNKGLDIEQYKNRFIEQLLNLKDRNGNYVYEKFRLLFTAEAGYNCWKVDEKFDPNNHFRSLPEDPEMTESRLMKVIQDLDQAMSHTQPKWEVIFVPRLPNPEECGIIFRIHHAYGDGLSFMNAFAEHLSSDRPFPYIIDPVKFRPPFWQSLIFHTVGYAMFGWTFLSLILSTTKPSPDRHPKASPDILYNTRTRLSLVELKTIQRKVKEVSISAILTTVIKNSIDKLNKGRMELPSLVLLANLPYPKAKLVNRVTHLTVNVPQKNEEDWMSQLESFSPQTNVVKNLSFFVNNEMNALIGKMSVAFKKKVNSAVTSLFVISNLPYVSRKIELCGCIQQGNYVWPTLRKSIFVSALSIGDTMDVAIQAGANLLNEEELESLVKEIKTQLVGLSNSS